MIRSWRGGVDRHPGRPEDPEGLPRHPEDPVGRTRRPETPEEQEGYEDLSGSRPPAIEYLLGICLLDTLRSQIECDEMSLHGHLFIVFLVSQT